MKLFSNVTTCLSITLLTFGIFSIINLSYAKDLQNKKSPHTPVIIVTENMPPMQIADDQQNLDGYAIDIVNALLVQVQQPNKISVTNWARAYKLALNTENVMIFSITRNQHRENLFKWVGDILTLENHLWRLSYRDDLQVPTLEQAKKGLIAIPRDDIQHLYLINNGFELNKNLMTVTDYKQSINLLLRERVDYFAGPRISLYYHLKQMGINTNSVKSALKMDNSINTLYIAFSRKTDDKVVNIYRQGLKQLKTTQTYRDITEKWKGQVNTTKQVIRTPNR